jgi:broad-specificity NMP kinase
MRIVVIGTSGAGRTTLGRTIALRLGVVHIELDVLNWQACGLQDSHGGEMHAFMRCRRRRHRPKHPQRPLIKTSVAAGQSARRKSQ